MTPRQVVVTARAEDQIRTIDRWWRTNAPDVFTEELAHVVERLSSAPHAGHPYPAPRPSGVRRVLLRVTRYHVYYTLDERALIVTIRAVWHTSRGRRPSLR